MGKVLDFIEKEVARGRRLHFTLLDPDKQSPEETGKLARAAQEAGSDAIMVGGSTGVDLKVTDRCVEGIKKASSLPVILFPGSAAGLTPRADAIFFMSMLNSTKRDFLIGQQVLGAPYVKRMGLEPIPMAYLIVEPGMRAGEVGGAELIPRNDPETAAKYALAAQYLGMRLVYLEAGSGAPQHVPGSMVKRVKEEISIPLIVGGGIRSVDAAQEAFDAGADIVVTGTLVEQVADVERALKPIIDAARRK
jgi:phosphoglycerol geranylgeranyltransferase